MTAPGLLREERLRRAGFSQNEVEAWRRRQSARLRGAGFSDVEISRHFGVPDPNLASYDRAATEYLGSRPEEELETIGFLRSIELGFQQSVTGLMLREELPEKVVGAEAGRIQRIGSQIGTLAGDLPAMVGGFAIGGGPTGFGLVTGTASAFALPAALRQVLMDRYEDGEVASFEEFWERFSAAALAAGKGYVTGAAVGAVGAVGAARQLPKLAVTAAEIATMVRVGAALEGHTPGPDEYIDAAILIGGMKTVPGAARRVRSGVAALRPAAREIAGKLRRTYVRSGERPAEIAEQAARDPSIKQDLLSTNQDIPRASRPRAALEVDPLLQRAAELVAERQNASPQRLASELRISRGRAEQLLEQLEQRRVVGERPPFEQAADRQVLVESVDVARLRIREGEAARVARAEEEIRAPSERTPGRGREDRVQADLERAQAEVRITQESLDAARAKLERLRSTPAKDLREAGEIGKAVAEGSAGFASKKAAVEAARRDVAELETRLTSQQAAAQPRQAGEGDGAPPQQPPAATGGAPPQPPAPQTPLEQAVASVNGRLSQAPGLVERTVDRFRGWTLDRFYTDWVDKLHPINVAVREMTAGKPLAEVNNAYQLARTLVGVTGKATHMLEHGTVSFRTGQVVGKSLREILAPVGARLDEFRAYITSARALELERRGIQTGIDTASARRVVSGLRRDFEPLRQDLLQYQRDVFQYLVDAGIVDRAQARVIQAANQDYIPLHRLVEESATRGATGRAGRRVRNPVLRMIGSERLIHDPLESVIRNTYTFIELAERNNVVGQFVDLAAATGRADFATRAKVAPVRIGLDRRERQQVVKLMQESTRRQLTPAETQALNTALENSFSIFRPRQKDVGANQVVRFKDGKREVWDLDPEIAKALTGMSTETANMLVTMLSAPAKFLRAGAVFSPEFVARNPIRDTMMAFIQSDAKFNFFLDSAIGGFALARKGPLYQQWLRSGGPMAELVAMDRRYLQTDINRLAGQTSLWTAAHNVLASPIEMLRAASSLAEQATRVAEFGRVTRGADGGRLGTSLRLAQEVAGRRAAPDLSRSELLRGGFASREISLDFGRIGARAHSMNLIAAFFNAQIQGVDKMVRTVRDHPTRTFVRLTAAITIPSVLLRIANEGADGFDEIADWQKDLFWLVPAEDEEGRNVWWRIPKPFQFGLLFGTLAERGVEHVLRDDPTAYDGFLEGLAAGGLPSFIPTAAVPLIEAYANTNMFTDRSIIPQSRERLLPQAQYTPYTTELAKALGGLVQMLPGLERSRAASPAIIENTVRAWTGGLGVHALNLLDASLQQAGVLPDPVEPADTLADIPFVKAFAVRHPSASAQSIADFYERYGEIEQILLTIKAFQREGNLEAAMLLQEVHGGQLVDLTQIRTALSKMSRGVRMIDQHPGITPEEKRNMIDRIYFGMIETARGGNEMLDALEAQAR